MDITKDDLIEFQSLEAYVQRLERIILERPHVIFQHEEHWRERKNIPECIELNELMIQGEHPTVYFPDADKDKVLEKVLKKSQLISTSDWVFGKLRAAEGATCERRIDEDGVSFRLQYSDEECYAMLVDQIFLGERRDDLDRGYINISSEGSIPTEEKKSAYYQGGEWHGRYHKKSYVGTIPIKTVLMMNGFNGANRHDTLADWAKDEKYPSLLDEVLKRVKMEQVFNAANKRYNLSKNYHKPLEKFIGRTRLLRRIVDSRLS
jgi:hypothetical protein